MPEQRVGNTGGAVYWPTWAVAPPWPRLNAKDML